MYFVHWATYNCYNNNNNNEETRRGGGNGCHQKMSEVLWAVHGIPVSSNCREDSGPINDSAYEFFEILCRKINDWSGNSREVSFLFQRLSVIIQRFNSAPFRDTFTLHNDPDL